MTDPNGRTEARAAPLEWNRAKTTRALEEEHERATSNQGGTCPHCGASGTEKPGILCVSCTTTALKRFGWGPL